MIYISRLRARRYAKRYIANRVAAEYAWQLVRPAHATRGDRASFMADYWRDNA